MNERSGSDRKNLNLFGVTSDAFPRKKTFKNNILDKLFYKNTEF